MKKVKCSLEERKIRNRGAAKKAREKKLCIFINSKIKSKR